MSNAQAGAELGPDLRQAFLRHLPERVSTVEKDWNTSMNGTRNHVNLNRSLQRIRGMAGAAGKYGLIQVSENLHALEQCFLALISDDAQPSDNQIEQINSLIVKLKAVSTALTKQPEGRVPHPKYRRSRIFCLDFDDTTAPSLIRVLENTGCTVFHWRRVQDLLREYSNGAPDVILVDSRQLETIGPLSTKLKGTESGQTDTPPMVVISTTDDLDMRLIAMRAGATAFFPLPLDDRAVAGRIKQLATRDSDRVFRVLIVDDDPSQADFAAAILRKADMEARTVTDPLRVLHALDTFRPDLILMDLYMPGADGKELTGIIRDQVEFVGIPIIFVSGEQDADKQLDALSAGGDDFIAKPIRPRHLIATIKNRVERIKALRGQHPDNSHRDPITHLFNRRHFFESLDDMLASIPHQPAALGLLIAELDEKEATQKKIGSEQTNSLLAEIGALIAARAEPQDLVARIDHGNFAVLAKRPLLRDLLQLAQDLVNSVVHNEYESVRLQPTLSVGLCRFDATGHSAEHLISRAIKACRSARNQGGNRVEQVDTTVAASEGKKSPRRDTLTLVQEALREGSFQVLFQPYLNVPDGKRHIYQMEPRLALDHGRQMPAAEFVPVTRRAGLGRDLDRWITGHAIEIMHQRRQSGSEVGLLISQSADTLVHTRCAEDLRDALRRRLLVGTGLVLEFDMVDVANNLKRAPALSEELQSMGISICLARFGHNDASYKILTIMRAAYVKVAEKSLNADPTTIGALIQRVHQAGAKIIVPPVSDPRSIAQPWLSGADLVQANAYADTSSVF